MLSLDLHRSEAEWVIERDLDHLRSAFEAPSLSLTSPPNMDFVTTPNSSPSGGLKRMHEALDGTGLVVREPSPAPSTTSSISALSTTPPPPATASLDGSSELMSAKTVDGPPPAKKRKLSPAEREERRRQKAQKEKERAEEKARKDEERRAKDEEKRQKNELKEEKRREKEFEKQQKEEQKERERRQREEEKDKQEKAQPRINRFFAKPPSAVASPNSKAPLLELKQTTVASTQIPTAAEAHTSNLESNDKSDYRATFLPFALPAHATLAPPNYFSWDEGAVRHMASCIDKAGQAQEDGDDVSLQESLQIIPAQIERMSKAQYTVKDVMEAINNIGTNASHPTLSSMADPFAELEKFPLKYIYFSQDVRPPYVGSYSKVLPTLRTARNPFLKQRPDTNYNYDSEAEWEEPEEGEDLGSEGASETESEADEEMEGFLDDEDAQDMPRKRVVLGDIEPLCSGLCWENETGHSLGKSFGKLEVLLDTKGLPIDPFTCSYWKNSDLRPTSGPMVSFLNTSKAPLQPQKGSVSNLQLNVLDSGTRTKGTKLSKVPGRILSGEDLEEFKVAVVASELNKQGTLAILKKRLPKVPNDVLRDTLNSVAERVGKKEVDKRWVIREEFNVTS